MVKFKCGEQEYYIDGYLASNLDVIKKYVLKQDGDAFIIITGGEGSGKSVLGQVISKYLDNDWSKEDMVFNGKDWKDKVLNAHKGQCVTHDEALNTFSWYESFSRETKEYKMITFEIRQKNAFHVLVCPQFYELDRVIAVHRSICLIQTYTKYNDAKNYLERGFFNFYNKRNKEKLWINCRKNMEYPQKYVNFYGRFTDQQIIPREEYLEMKKEGLRAVYTKREKKNDEKEKLAEQQALADIAFKQGIAKMVHQFEQPRKRGKMSNPCPKCNTPLENKGYVTRDGVEFRRYDCDECHKSFYERIKLEIMEDTPVPVKPAVQAEAGVVVPVVPESPVMESKPPVVDINGAQYKQE